jgi:hypothetical protein
MTAPDPLAIRSGLAFTLLAKAAEKRGSRLSVQATRGGFVRDAPAGVFREAREGS